jgi:hypothetical protein
VTITDIERLERYVAMLRHECAYNGPCSDNGDGCICSAAELHNRKQSAALRQSSPPDGQTATHRHKKRGSEYVLIGFGTMQAEEWFYATNDSIEPELGPSVDMAEVAIYRSVEQGSLWVRPREEFEDGRFEAIPTPSSETKAPARSLQAGAQN